MTHVGPEARPVEPWLGITAISLTRTHTHTHAHTVQLLTTGVLPCRRGDVADAGRQLGLPLVRRVPGAVAGAPLVTCPLRAADGSVRVHPPLISRLSVARACVGGQTLALLILCIEHLHTHTHTHTQAFICWLKTKQMIQTYIIGLIILVLGHSGLAKGLCYDCVDRSQGYIA